MTSPAEEYALLIPAALPVTAELAKDLLESAGIPCLFHAQDRDLAELGMAVHMAISRPDVYVPRAALEQAIETLRSAWGEFEAPGLQSSDSPATTRIPEREPAPWNAEAVLSLAGDYRAACVLSAAVDLGIFEVLSEPDRSAEEIAAAIDGDVRATTILLDALVAIDLLVKRGDWYTSATGIDSLLGSRGPGSLLAMARHHGSCLRRWAQLATVVRTGQPAERVASVQGQDADEFAFIEAMDNISAPTAPIVFGDLGDLGFSCVLDLGGGSGTWTAELLRRHPNARAILFDLPHVLPWARERLEREGVADRVELVAGDFEKSPLPHGADLVWLSAIAHQNSREQNRRLFAAIHEALEPGGRVLLRDVVLDSSRTSPTFGALFAVNMLVATEGGDTFTLEEYREDLEGAGFAEVRLVRPDPLMNAVVEARKR